MAPNGYAWWYIDALSDDGRHGLTLIFLVGNVFSPYYARARRRGMADPLRHCAVNVALYGPGRGRWTLTERDGNTLYREEDCLHIGPSGLERKGDRLEVSLDEVTAPLPSRVRGRVVVHLDALADFEAALDPAGTHRWRPISPGARVEVHLDRPGLRWSGLAYVDSNAGDAPLEDAFQGWHWCRARVGDATAVTYDVARRDGTSLALALRFDGTGHATAIASPPVIALPATAWGLARAIRAEGGEARLLRTLEDTPFYARSLVEARLLGAPATVVHESLCLDRFRRGWVQWLLPFRMPRIHRRLSRGRRECR